MTETTDIEEGETQQAGEQNSATASEIFGLLTVVGLLIISIQYRAVITEIPVLQSQIGFLFASIPFLFAMLVAVTIAEWLFNTAGNAVGIELNKPLRDIEWVGVGFAVLPLTLGVVAVMLYPFGLPERPEEVVGMLVGVQITLSSVYPIIAVSGLLNAASTEVENNNG